jgi:carbon-monoxide dehydrogenase medium subunit
MKPSPFEYHAPTKIEQVAELLAEYDNTAVMAGNQTLGMDMSYREITADHVIDLNAVEDLACIEKRDNTVKIGAMTRHETLESSSIIEEQLPMIASAAEQIAGPAVRTRGTLGGALGKAHPAGNYPTALLALDATVYVHSTDGIREVPIETYLQDGIGDNELIGSVTVPIDRFPPTRSGMAFLELKRAALTWPTLSAGTAVTIDDPESESPVITDAAIAIANVGPAQIRVPEAENAVTGSSLSDNTLEAAEAVVVDAADPVDEVHADAEYKTGVAGEYARRSLQTSYERAVSGRIDTPDVSRQ